jgi:hypothetical protein
MNHSKTVVGVAAPTQCWFINAPSINLDCNTIIADIAAEECFSHLGNQ